MSPDEVRLPVNDKLVPLNVKLASTCPEFEELI